MTLKIHITNIPNMLTFKERKAFCGRWLSKTSAGFLYPDQYLRIKGHTPGIANVCKTCAKNLPPLLILANTELS